MSLRGFSDDEINNLIKISSDGYSDMLTEYIGYLSKIAGNSPYSMQMACHYFVDLQKESGDFGTVQKQQLEDKLQTGLQEYHLKIWDSLNEIHRDILTQIAAGKNINDTRDYIIRDLTKKDFISIEHGKGVFTSELFRNFIRQKNGMSAPVSGPFADLPALISRMREYFTRKFIRQNRR
jgi:hypothetical protein